MGDEREIRWRSWMTAAQRGDAPTYDKLLQELIPYLRRFVGRRLFDRTAAEDVVQNILISLHRARQTYRAERPFRPWLHAVARNAVIDHVRARTRRSEREVLVPEDKLPEPAAQPGQAGEQPSEDLSPRMREALASLSAKQREAVELIHLQGLSVAEAATRAGVTQTALKVRAHRGYRALEARLGTRDDEEDLA